MKRTNQKQERHEMGGFGAIRTSAVYSCKHNNGVDFDKVFKEKMKEWEGLSIVKASDLIAPFGYKSEAYKVPDTYYYDKDTFERILEANSVVFQRYGKQYVCKQYR